MASLGSVTELDVTTRWTGYFANNEFNFNGIVKMTNTSNFNWFDLNKYTAVETFDIDDWHLQLDKRQMIHLFAKENPDTLKRIGESRWEYINGRAKIFIASIKENPIFIEEKRKNSVLSVRDTDLNDLHLATYTNNNLEKALYSLKDIFGHNAGRELVLPKSKTKSAYGNTAMLTIDLSATDEQLKKNFSEWLKTQRTITQYTIREKQFTSKDFEKWINNKVLPYLDLTLIANAEDIQLTQNKLGRLLFPDEYNIDLTERIRRSVKPLAEWLLDKKTVEAIRIQARAT